MSQTIGNDIVYDENECIGFIHDWANGITEEDCELL